MRFRDFPAVAAAMALVCCNAGFVNAQPNGRHARVATQESVAEVAATRDLNLQQLASARPAPQMASNETTAPVRAISPAMRQRVPGGDPLHSGAAGGGGHFASHQPVSHN